MLTTTVGGSYSVVVISLVFLREGNPPKGSETKMGSYFLPAFGSIFCIEQHPPGTAGTWLHRAMQILLCLQDFSKQHPPSEDKVPSFFLATFCIGMIFCFYLVGSLSKGCIPQFLPGFCGKNSVKENASKKAEFNAISPAHLLYN